MSVHLGNMKLKTLKVLVLTINAQWEGMGAVGSTRYEPALLPPCPTVRVLKPLFGRPGPPGLKCTSAAAPTLQQTVACGLWGFKLQELVNCQKFSTLRVKILAWTWRLIY